jgi:hypothetical protein
MMMAGGEDNRDSLACAAVVFSQTRATFSAHDYAEFLGMGGVAMDDETADEFLSDLVDAGTLRQIGPAIYAAKVQA